MSWKGNEVVDVHAEPAGELPGPRLAGQRNPRIGQTCTQGALRRYRAQHVAQLQGTKNGQCADLQMPQ